jgi:hypothetical protein
MRLSLDSYFSLVSTSKVADYFISVPSSLHAILVVETFQTGNMQLEPRLVSSSHNSYINYLPQISRRQREE